MGILVREDDLREEWLALDLGKVEGCRGLYIKWHRCKRVLTVKHQANSKRL